MLIPLTIGFISGLLLGSLVPYLPISTFLLVLIVGGALTWFERRGRLLRRHSLFIFGSMLVGILYWTVAVFLTPPHPLNDLVSKEPMVLKGVVCEPVRHGPNRAVIVLCDARIANANADVVLGRVRLTWRDPDRSLVQGDAIAVLTRLRPPSGMVNPGGFDYGAYLERQGIDAVGSVTGPGRMTVHPSTMDSPRWMFWRLIDGWRDHIRHAAEASLHDAALGMYLGMIIGEPDAIRPETRDLFMATGTVHILSISGSHLGLIAVASFFLIRGVCRLLPPLWLLHLSRYTTPTRLAAMLTVPPVAFYTVLAGAQLATVRSLVMIMLFLLAVWLGRDSQILLTLACAAWLVLLHDPTALYDISFQLSFLSVLAIALVLARTDRRNDADSLPVSTLERVGTWLRGYGLMTVSVTIATAPIVAFYFHQIAWVGLIANLIIVPIAGFVLVPIGLVSAVWCLLAGGDTLPAADLNQAIGDIFFRTVETFALLPGAEWHVASPSIPAMAAFYILLALALWAGRSRLMYGSLALAALILAWWGWSPRERPDGETLRVTFLDVGQGDASLIELPDGTTLLIDGGATYETLDIGRAVVAPFLWDRGITHLDHVIGTHPQLDHIGGLAWAVKQFDVGRYWNNGMSREEAFYRRLQDNLQLRRVTEEVAEEGRLIVDTSSCRVRVLNPPAASSIPIAVNLKNGSALNNRSIVTRLDCGPHSFLFTADIERETIARLSADPWFKARVVKVPHHGARSSLDEEWIAHAPPEVAVISVGRANAYGHPTVPVLTAYEGRGVRVLRTDRDGAIQIVAELSSPDLIIRSARDELIRRVPVGRTMLRAEQDNLLKLWRQWLRL